MEEEGRKTLMTVKMKLEEIQKVDVNYNNYEKIFDEAKSICTIIENQTASLQEKIAKELTKEQAVISKAKVAGQTTPWDNSVTRREMISIYASRLSTSSDISEWLVFEKEFLATTLTKFHDAYATTKSFEVGAEVLRGVKSFMDSYEEHRKKMMEEQARSFKDGIQFSMQQVVIRDELLSKTIDILKNAKAPDEDIRQLRMLVERIGENLGKIGEQSDGKSLLKPLAEIRNELKQLAADVKETVAPPEKNKVDIFKKDKKKEVKKVEEDEELPEEGAEEEG